MKPSAIKHFLFVIRCCILFMIAVSLYACNNNAEETSTDTTPSLSEATPATTETPIAVDTTAKVDLPATDTTNRIPGTDIIPPRTDVTPSATISQPSVSKSATLGYSYPVKMYRGEPKNINAYVAIRNQESRVRDTLKAIVDEQSANDGDSVVINVTNVIWYKKLKIELLDPASDFTITAVHNDPEQIIDTIDGNRWRWSIKTTTDKKVTELILKITAEKEDGTRNRFDDKTIHIPIKIDKNIVRRFFDYLTDNPAVSIPILVSLFTFLGWAIKRRYDKK